MQKPYLALFMGLSLSLTAGCSSSTAWTPGFVQPYQIDIQQGNLLDEEAVARLRPGMSRDEVRFLLGTPTLKDVFHADRWTYLRYEKPGKEKPRQSGLVVHFEGDRVSRIEPFEDKTAAPQEQPATP
ncbi:MAG: outer membrane protein assembly factor BamE [Pseudomonadota bacterium]